MTPTQTTVGGTRIVIMTSEEYAALESGPVRINGVNRPRAEADRVWGEQAAIIRFERAERLKAEEECARLREMLTANAAESAETITMLRTRNAELETFAEQAQDEARRACTEAAAKATKERTRAEAYRGLVKLLEKEADERDKSATFEILRPAEVKPRVSTYRSCPRKWVFSRNAELEQENARLREDVRSMDEVCTETHTQLTKARLANGCEPA
jgi:hypothetical protein